MPLHQPKLGMSRLPQPCAILEFQVQPSLDRARGHAGGPALTGGGVEFLGAPCNSINAEW